MATPIDSTRRGLPHVFGMSGQTEATLAQSEVERSATEKESRFESLASERLSKLRTMEIAMSTMEAMHVKQVEAIHDSYKRMHGSRSTEDRSKEGAMQIAMDSKVNIKAIKRSTCKKNRELSVQIRGGLRAHEAPRRGR